MSGTRPRRPILLSEEDLATIGFALAALELHPDLVQNAAIRARVSPLATYLAGQSRAGGPVRPRGRAAGEDGDGVVDRSAARARAESPQLRTRLDQLRADRAAARAATYELGVDATGGRWIRCLVCGMPPSAHPDDIAQRYCAFCHQFHARHEN